MFKDNKLTITENATVYSSGENMCKLNIQFIYLGIIKCLECLDSLQIEIYTVDFNFISEFISIKGQNTHKL